jgi:hypothetical protein
MKPFLQEYSSKEQTCKNNPQCTEQVNILSCLQLTKGTFMISTSWSTPLSPGNRGCRKEKKKLRDDDML